MNRKHGVTGPLSSRIPSEAAICKSEILSDFLLSSQFYESLCDSQTRERVLGILNHAAKTHFNGRLHTFGSYRLGVHQKNSDIDTLLIVPRKYTHNDFFSSFYDDLSALDGVSELHKVEDAYVPLIKLKLFGISIDLVFARTGLTSVDNISLLDDSLLKDMDDKSIISINGSRVTDMLIELVPDRNVFHTALRCIKYWAKRRGIYGNAYGYFGGVAYAISVARICQFYPNGCAFTIVSKFFDLFSNWEWPSPVILCTPVNKNFGLRVWDPKINYADRFHKMPVITPAYPSMCSTHNVGVSTMTLMIEEFKRGAEILKKGKEIDSVLFDTKKIKTSIVEGDLLNTDPNNTLEMKDGAFTKDDLINNDLSVKNKVSQVQNNTNTVEVSIPSPNSTSSIFNSIKDNVSKPKIPETFKTEFLEILKTLTNQTHFFKTYKSYLQVKVPDDNTWSSYVESRIRHLCIKLETTEQYATAVVVQAFPYPSGFRTMENDNKFIHFFIGLKYESKIKVNIDKPVKEFKKTVLDWERNENWGLDILLIKKKDVGAFLKSYYDQKDKIEECGNESTKRRKVETVSC